MSRALKNQHFLEHVNQKTQERITNDLRQHDFYGFNGANFVPQHVGEPFDLVNGKLVPAQVLEPVALGNGWPMLEAAMSGVAYRISKNGNRLFIKGDAFQYFVDHGIVIAHQYRINDMYNLTDEVINLPYLAMEVQAIDAGAGYMARMVSNPAGTKGGIPLSSPRHRLIIADTLSASDEATKKFLASLETNAPYHRFTNTYDIARLRLVLIQNGYRPDF